MTQRCQQARLALESRQPFAIGGEGRGEHLDRHVAVAASDRARDRPRPSRLRRAARGSRRRRSASQSNSRDSSDCGGHQGECVIAFAAISPSRHGQKPFSASVAGDEAMLLRGATPRRRRRRRRGNPNARRRAAPARPGRRLRGVASVRGRQTCGSAEIILCFELFEQNSPASSGDRHRHAVGEDDLTGAVGEGLRFLDRVEPDDRRCATPGRTRADRAGAPATRAWAASRVARSR